MALDDTSKGYLAVFTSIMFFGSFGSFVKSHAVQSRQVHPIVVQLYFSVAIFATGFATVLWEDLELTAYGALGGLIWTCCSLLSFVSITHAGLGRAQGLWSGSSIVTSFFIGTVGFHEHLKSLAWSLTALALMLLGVAAIAGVDTVGSDEAVDNADGFKSLGDDGGDPPLLGADHFGSSVDPEKGGKDDANRYGTGETGIVGPSSVKNGVDTNSMNGEKKTSLRAKAFGIATSLLTGLFNGSIMIPFTYNKVKGVVYIVSFGMGVLGAGVLSALLFFGLYQREMPKFHFDSVVVPVRCLVAGGLWNVGNGASVYATAYLGQAVGFSLTQLALLVGGLWGVLFFREIRGTRNLVQFAAGSTLLVGGAVILGMLGKGDD